jgi:hypothetical protein
MIEEMCAEFDRDAIELFERVGQQQKFALGVDRAALHPCRIPGRADLDAPVRRIQGSIEPDACKPSLRSISLRMSSGFGTNVYQSFHSSPSFTASVRPSI